jgi:hypothetical protein
LAEKSCVLDAQTGKGVCVPTPHVRRHTDRYSLWLEGYICAMGHVSACVISRNIVANLYKRSLASLRHETEKADYH